MKQDGDKLYRQIVAISEDYFGPAAQRFINRILRNHLNKSPSQVTKKDIKDIINWILLAEATIHENSDIKEFAERLKKLGR